MNVTNFIVNVTSDRPDELKRFYRDVVGLQPNTDMGDAAFMAGPTPFLIDGHSEIRGKAKEPGRVLLTSSSMTSMPSRSASKDRA